jgi:DNA-binding FadR family transcriptional regulator
VFQKTSQNRIYQDLVEQIQEAILSRKLKPGDKLPSQRELSEMFQTSRASLREALRVLEDKGLIEMRLGIRGGAMVKEANIDRVSESLAFLIRYRKVSLHQLAEFRIVVEGFVAERACKLANKDDIKKLKKLLVEAQNLMKAEPPTWKPYAQIDAEFHKTLSRISKNPLFEATLQPIYENIHNYFYQYLPDSASLIRDNYEDLSKIVRAIEDGNPVEAKKVAMNHVAKFNRLMTEKEHVIL